MILNVMLLLLFGACSLSPEGESFVTSIQGEYTDSSTNYSNFLIEKKSGDFVYHNINYQFEEAITATNAIYFLDDLQYVGLFFNPSNQQLRQVISTNTDKTGIDFNTNVQVLLGTKITN